MHFEEEILEDQAGSKEFEERVAVGESNTFQVSESWDLRALEFQEEDWEEIHP